MEKLDEALVGLRQDMNDTKKHSAFYDLFLNSSFFVPIFGDNSPQDEQGTRDVLPVITESGGKDFLMIFSSLERLKVWDQLDEEMQHIEVPGHILALTTVDPLHWALNVGTEFSKEFLPEEIAWLREAVERCNADAAAKEESCCKGVNADRSSIKKG